MLEQDDDIHVTTLDLFNADLPAVAGAEHRDQVRAHDRSGPRRGPASWRQIERTIEQFLDADIYLLTVPMWNLGIPYALKYYIDAIVQPGYLFRYNEQGQPEGLVTNRKMICVTSRGGDYSGEPMRRSTSSRATCAAIFGFVGITDITSSTPSRWTSRWTFAGRHSEPRFGEVREYAARGEWRCGPKAAASVPDLAGVKSARMAVA